MERCGSPSTVRRCNASLFWCAVSCGLRPTFTPCAFARARPALVRSRMRRNSNLAAIPKQAPTSSQNSDSVSTIGSAIDTNRAPGVEGAHEALELGPVGAVPALLVVEHPLASGGFQG